MKIKYEAIVTNKGGRNGHITSCDGVLDMDVALPKEMNGPGVKLTNPEQLFAAGYSTCFGSAMQSAARKKNISLQDFSVTAHVGLFKNEKDIYNLQVKLVVKLPGLDTTTARSIMEAAHHLCPYSLAVKNNVEVTLELEEEPLLIK
ncbi:MAG: organic hydroperoxide resistance protein [Candidatus Margulisbacteria bacterium]|nr:organic hydroperoxide resistance protein [Candidatus Margulisiibacteriota bacterium]